MSWQNIRKGNLKQSLHKPKKKKKETQSSQSTDAVSNTQLQIQYNISNFKFPDL